jgi:hypothetical protein
MRSALILLALIISSFGVTTAGAAEPCTGTVGQWNWFIGGQVTFSEGGQAHWKPGTVGMPPASGTWTCDTRTGSTVVTWQNGFVDTLKLSPDGTKLTGKSSTGVAVNGWRNAPATAPAAPSGNAARPSTTTGSSTATPAKPPSSGAIDHNPSVREILQGRPKPDPHGWKQDRSGGPQKGPKPFEGWQ